LSTLSTRIQNAKTAIVAAAEASETVMKVALRGTLSSSGVMFASFMAGRAKLVVALLIQTLALPGLMTM